MKENNVIQWLGMICLLAGISRMGMTPSSFIWGTDSVPELSFGIVASILMSVGTIAAYLVQSRETGLWGFITVIAMSIGNAATSCMLWFVLQSPDPSVTANSMALNILHLFILIGLTLGTLVFIFLSYRAKIFPRWIIILLVMMLVSMVLPIEDNKYFAFFWGLAYVGMGYTIWAGRLHPSKIAAS